MHSLMSMGIIGVVWVLWGYTIAFGPSVGGLFGDFSLFGLNGVSAEVGPDGGIPPLLFMMFQGMFAIIAPAILTGAFAERMKFRRLCPVHDSLGNAGICARSPLGLG